jgi:putative transposase
MTESARYVLGCYRYIELNPIRAGMVQHASSYLWSSYAVNSGMRRDPLLSPHVEFAALGLDTAACHAAYRALFDQPLDSSLLRAIRDAANGDYPLGSDTFKASLLAATGRRTERQKAGRKAKSPHAAYALE